MTTLAVSADLLQLLKRDDISTFVPELLQTPTDWYSKPELGHRVAGGHKVDRSVFYRLVEALASDLRRGIVVAADSHLSVSGAV